MLKKLSLLWTSFCQSYKHKWHNIASQGIDWIETDFRGLQFSCSITVILLQWFFVEFFFTIDATPYFSLVRKNRIFE